jgi:hypothetical protein
MGKVDNIIFDKPIITIEDYPEIMWKRITTDKFVKRRLISITIMVSIPGMKYANRDTLSTATSSKHLNGNSFFNNVY